ncbi:hypothetical protein CHS0354_018561 [Potamilus streckersoni]|uniref:Radical S-adenosyl methionine domain-containing protein 1, mitochondrial n=1 Tax=Potamilus streckersoni TaxID=2493646 RepID=A0AAE0TAT0_9BIVA|nr:hypothetical protein CHS0354_018561 [Potamilus streckersoni]
MYNFTPPPSDKCAGIYIHVPFCTKICPFCSFPVFRNRPDLHETYVSALLKEIELTSAQRYAGTPITSLYIGGGTPSLLSVENLVRIVNHVTKYYRVADRMTVSLECNPEGIVPEYLYALKNIGITRLSLGIQSFDDGILHRLGRVHNSEDCTRIVDAAQDAGFTNINLDLMYGTPFHTADNTMRDVERFLAYRPAHISAYALTVEPGTRFAVKTDYARQIEQQSGAISEIFAVIRDRLQGAGIYLYEVSNFAAPGAESVQNLLYWTDADYYGFGPGAHGKTGGQRRANTSNFRLWQQALHADRLPPADEETLTPDNRRDEFLMIRLRTVWGFDFDELHTHTGLTREAFLALPAVQTILRADYAELRVHRFRLTPSGLMLADRIAADISCDAARLTA